MNSRAHLAQAAAAARGLAEALGALAKDAPGLDADGNTYDSTRLPPRTSRRRFAELCRSNRIPGAHQEGKVWVYPREAWHAARCAREPRPERPRPWPRPPLHFGARRRPAGAQRSAPPGGAPYPASTGLGLGEWRPS
jgi:hypothetical protein